MLFGSIPVGLDTAEATTGAVSIRLPSRLELTRRSASSNSRDCSLKRAEKVSKKSNMIALPCRSSGFNQETREICFGAGRAASRVCGLERAAKHV